LFANDAGYETASNHIGPDTIIDFAILASIMNLYQIRENAMVSTEHTQSLSDFRQKAGETLDRLNRTGNAEILTVNGEARAVLLSPAAYDELARDAQLSRDVTFIRRAMQEIQDGKGMEAGAFFDGLRSTLLAMKAKQQKGRAG